jgi:heptosyltransferase-3
MPSSIRINDLRRRMARSLMRLLFGPAAPPSGEALPREGVYRILICHLGLTLGNTLLLTPLLQELDATWPGAEIDLATRSKAASVVYTRYTSIRCIFHLPAHGLRHPLRLWRELHAMRKTHYDLAIDPDPQSQSGRLLLLMAKANYKLGFSGPKKSGNVTHAVSISGAVASTGQRPVFLLRHALGKTATAAYPLPDIRLDSNEREWGRNTLGRVLEAAQVQRNRKIIVGIFANATGPKFLGATWWIRLLSTLEDATPDAHLVEIIPASGRTLLGSRFSAYCSSDVRRVASVLSALDFYISLDCGIMHLACASHTPTIAIFTTTNAAEWGPYGPSDHTIRAYDMTPEAVALEIASAISECRQTSTS